MRHGREGFPMGGTALHGRKGLRRARKGLGVGEGIVGVGGGKRRENEPRPQAEKGAEAGTVIFFFLFLMTPPLRTTTLHVQVRPLLLKSSTSTWRVVVGGEFSCGWDGGRFFLSKALLRH